MSKAFNNIKEINAVVEKVLYSKHDLVVDKDKFVIVKSEESYAKQSYAINRRNISFLMPNAVVTVVNGLIRINTGLKIQQDGSIR